jgi:hypothetical protein
MEKKSFLDKELDKDDLYYILTTVFPPITLFYKRTWIGMLTTLGIHNWEYWEVSADIYFDCEDHKRMNTTLQFINRRCKWDGKEQHRLGGLFMMSDLYDKWHYGNIEDNGNIKHRVFGCSQCNKDG